MMSYTNTATSHTTGQIPFSCTESRAKTPCTTHSTPQKILLFLHRCSLPCLILLNLSVLAGLCVLDIFTTFGQHISMQQKWGFIMMATLTFNLGVFFLELHADKRYRKVKKILRTKALAAQHEKRDTEKMIAILSHEIRNPMQTIVAITHQLQKTGLGRKQQEYLHEFEQSGQHMLCLLEDLLQSCETKSASDAEHDIPFTTDNLVQPLQLTFASAASRKQIAFSIINKVDSGHYFRGDLHSIRRILMNLCDNALKYTEKGKITLTILKDKQDYLHFDVTDTGKGIPVDKQQVIFREFERLNHQDENENMAGLGLGLALSRKLAARMQGTLRLVHSTENGSCFRLTLPLPAATASQQKDKTDTCAENPQKKPENISTLHPASSRPDLPAAQGMHGQKSRKKQRILVVEDNSLQSQLLRDLLTDSGEVVCAYNGAEALQYCFDSSFEVILMDLHMPVLDGFEATRQIRNWEKAKGLKPAMIIALTADNTISYRDELFATGFNEILKKPVTQAELQGKLSLYAKHAEPCFQ
ncbi:MAG: response regulator [Pseudomonadales bacterium]|nr:response regulator [Pseudomonadales bacterium]